MKNSFLKGSFKWGAMFACINVIMALVLPVSNSLDLKAVLILSPISGFVGGVVLHILNFIASETIKYHDYRLAKAGGVWSNHNAIRRARFITVCGLLGVGVLLGVVTVIAFSTYPPHGNGLAPLFAPLFAVVGFGLGVITYFFFWALASLISRTNPFRDEAFRDAGKFTTTLNQLYQKWKNHDYRS